MMPRALFALPGVVLLAQFGCGASAEERQLDSMRAEIDRIRESRDRADGAPTERGTAGPSLVVPQAYTSSAPVRPPAPVVQIGRDDERAHDEDVDPADPQDTTPRPTIRVFGSARTGGRNPRRGDDQIEQSAPDDAAGASGTAPRGDAASQAASRHGREGSPLDPEAKRAYDAAYALVSAKRFDEALDSLAAFLVKWPDHPYADNAMYWRGECYFARGDYVHASEQFDGVLKRFPAGNKAPDALLKLGMSEERLGHAVKAKESFDRLVQQFPQSDAAGHIPGPRTRTASPPGPAQEERR